MPEKSDNCRKLFLYINIVISSTQGHFSTRPLLSLSKRRQEELIFSGRWPEIHVQTGERKEKRERERGGASAIGSWKMGWLLLRSFLDGSYDQHLQSRFPF